ncbi:MAG: tRNA (guanosine(46)-N7)-methyltransferase TrmB [Chitinophagales bacterium]|nr:tRNA (guanosine(46)-N7)-methyltransferase TrmB [Chitinophagales bacterium]
MGKPKLEKFAELNTFPNVFHNFKHEDPELVNCHKQSVDLRSRWKSYFENNNPLVLELACGRGDYTVEMAKLYPDKNYIGIDIKGNRIWTGAKFALDNHLDNVAFIRSRIEYIDHFFGRNEVGEIWITFTDPFPRKGDEKRRLSHRRFLEKYAAIGKSGGTLHFKTDNKDLFEFSIEEAEAMNYEILQVLRDIYSLENLDPVLKIQTHYEKKHLKAGRKIYYFKFKFP